MKSVLTRGFLRCKMRMHMRFRVPINIYQANPTLEARNARFWLMPFLGRLPEGARNHALEQLNSMVPQDLQRTAQRLAD